jgi:hypothetical protein
MRDVAEVLQQWHNGWMASTVNWIEVLCPKQLAKLFRERNFVIIATNRSAP